MKSNNEEKLVTFAEAARVLSVAKRTIHRMVQRGVLKPVYVTPDAPRLRWSDLVQIMQG